MGGSGYGDPDAPFFPHPRQGSFSASGHTGVEANFSHTSGTRSRSASGVPHHAYGGGGFGGPGSGMPNSGMPPPPTGSTLFSTTPQHHPGFPGGDASRLLGGGREEFEALRRRLAENEAEQERLRAEVARLEKDLATVRSNLEARETEIATFRTFAAEEKRMAKEHHESAIASVRNELVAASQELERLQLGRASPEAEVAAVSTLREELANALQELEQLKKEAPSSSEVAAMAALREELAAAQAEAASTVSLREELAAARQELYQVQKNFVPISGEVTVTATLQEELAITRAELERLENKVATGEKDVVPRAELDAAHKELERLRREHSVFSEVKPLPLRVTVVGASGLYNADGMLAGVSDPYCICEVPDDVPDKKHMKFTTKTVPNNLDPVWNHTGEIPGFIGRKDSLEFQVWDKDTVKCDSLLGKARLSAEDVIPGVHELRLTGAKHAQGTIRVEIHELPAHRHEATGNAVALQADLDIACQELERLRHEHSVASEAAGKVGVLQAELDSARQESEELRRSGVAALAASEEAERTMVQMRAELDALRAAGPLGSTLKDAPLLTPDITSSEASAEGSEEEEARRLCKESVVAIQGALRSAEEMVSIVTSRRAAMRCREALIQELRREFCVPGSGIAPPMLFSTDSKAVQTDDEGHHSGLPPAGRSRSRTTSYARKSHASDLVEWDSEWMKATIRKLFEEIDVESKGYLRWNGGECSAFIVGFFKAHDLPPPELPLVIFRQIFSEVKVETGHNEIDGLNLEECGLYARRVHGMISSFKNEFEMQKDQQRKSRLSGAVDLNEVSVAYRGRTSWIAVDDVKAAEGSAESSGTL